MKKTLISMCMLCVAAFAGAQQLTIEEEIDTLTKRVYADYFAATSPVSDEVCDAQLANGSWADIDYSSKALAYWPPIYHLQRLKSMAHSYAAEADKTSDNAKKLADGVVAGLQYWESVKPTSNNWWYQDIGKQKEFIYILILMEDAVPQTLRDQICNYLVVSSSNQSGANLTDMATGLLIRGLLQHNGDYITDAVGKIASVGEIKNKGKDGCQIDHTYLFHNQLLFSINYNLVTLNCLSMWSNTLRGTRFQFDRQIIDIVRDIMLEGNRWMKRGLRVDWATTGRFISIPTALNTSCFLTTTRYLLEGDEENRDRYQNFLDVLNGEKEDTLVGNRYYFRGEYMVNQRPHFMYSVRMSSNRISGTEMGNGQNICGYWLGQGANCLMRHTEEYDSIFPFWDWAKVPGTTAADELPTCGFGMKSGNDFSGGVTNGTDGMASMQVSMRGVYANKSWFVFEDEVVCLGNGITSPTNINKVYSTIEQRRLMGPVLVDGVEVGKVSNKKLENPHTVYHDSTLYVFPKQQSLYLSAEDRTSSWYNISTIESHDIITDSVFALWYDHGRMPDNDSYCYVTVPYIHPDSVDAYVENLPIKVVQATHNAHVVTHTGKQLTGISFFNKGTVTVDSRLDVQASRKCLVMVDQSCEPIKVTVSDPVQSGNKLTVTLKHKDICDEEIVVPLPTGNYSGQSVTIESEIDRNNVAGISDACGTEATVSVSNGQLEIEGLHTGDRVSVFTAFGTQVCNFSATADSFSCILPANNVYVVRVNDITKKFIVK